MDGIENNENLQDEIVTVTPGEEHKTVEEEMAEVTPVAEEAPAEEEKKDEEEVVEEQKEEEDTASLETPSEEKTEEAEDKEEDKSDDTPSESDETEKESEEVTESVDEDVEEASTESDELGKVKAELEAMREAETTRKLVADREASIQKAAQDFEVFSNNLKDAILDTFKQYGIDPDVNIEELKKDPAKFQIAQDIVTNAQRIQAEKQAELMKPITEASNAIVFREAGKMMAEFKMSEEQTKVCAETLIAILDATGLNDIQGDLKAKVELAVAKAKMQVPDVVEVKKEEAAKVEDVVEEKVESKEEPDKEVAKEENKEDVQKAPVEEKPSVEAFKESASVGTSNASLGDGVDEDNVLEKLASLPFKERTAFLLKHADLVDRAASKRRAQGR